MPDEISFALTLNLHQPAGNLEHLLEHEPWDARQILWALDRIPRALWRHEGRARVHLSLSGTLLETLSDPAFQEQVYGTVDCGSLLWHLQNRNLVEVLGTGYYHPVLPLIPEEDRDEQLRRWQGIATHLLGRSEFGGFWPPEMGFSEELIPLLRQRGYRYVLVDSEHVVPVTPMEWHELRYRPHIARYGDDEIIVVVRDRELSDAQESGMDAGWFIHEVCERTKHCDFPPLLTTATDGDNGGWFRNAEEKSNFWTVFHDDLLERVGKGWSSGIRPAFIHEYLERHGAHGEVRVRTGAWNTGWHHGRGFTQWIGGSAQRAALAAVAQTSAEVRAAGDPEEARWRVLRAETSCNFYWGAAWVDRCHADLDSACQVLADQAKLADQTEPNDQAKLADQADPAATPAEPAVAAGVATVDGASGGGADRASGDPVEGASAVEQVGEGDTQTPQDRVGRPARAEADPFAPLVTAYRTLNELMAASSQ